MKILLCPDKFKGSLSATEACQAIANGLKKSGRQFDIEFHPMADGGEGSLEVLSSHLNLEPQNVMTTDPIGREIRATYFTSANAAFIEVASASGLVLLKNEERNPLHTSTFGTGKLIADALAKGFRTVYLFLGGSATNDAGMGIAAALGHRFLDENNEPLEPVGKNLSKVKRIDNNRLYDYKKIKITLLCDVTNPLFGQNGAACVYAPQKGATKDQVSMLDSGLRHFSKILLEETGVEVGSLPGSGAAGGIGASLVALFGAEIESGFAIISKLTSLEPRVQSADWVISGEGKLDEQSLQGKVVSGVIDLCQKYVKPLALFVGRNDLEENATRTLGVRQVFSITDLSRNLSDAMENGAGYLEEMALKAWPHLQK